MKGSLSSVSLPYSHCRVWCIVNVQSIYDFFLLNILTFLQIFSWILSLSSSSGVPIIWILVCLISSLEKEMATHFRILAWRTPWTEDPVVHGAAKSLTRLSEWTATATILSWRSLRLSSFFKNSFFGVLFYGTDFHHPVLQVTYLFCISYSAVDSF